VCLSNANAILSLARPADLSNIVLYFFYFDFNLEKLFLKTSACFQLWFLVCTILSCAQDLIFFKLYQPADLVSPPESNEAEAPDEVESDTDTDNEVSISLMCNEIVIARFCLFTRLCFAFCIFRQVELRGIPKLHANRFLWSTAFAYARHYLIEFDFITYSYVVWNFVRCAKARNV